MREAAVRLGILCGSLISAEPGRTALLLAAARRADRADRRPALVGAR